MLKKKIALKIRSTKKKINYGHTLQHKWATVVGEKLEGRI